MRFKEKCLLVKIHSALSDALGDTDPIDDLTEDEMREEQPILWAAQRIAEMIGPGSWDKYS